MDKDFNPYFNPDEIVITKTILRKIINGIINRWKKSKDKTFFGIKGLEAFRMSLRLQSDQEIQETFSSIIICVNEMQQINAMMRMKKENPNADVLADMVLKKLENGELFND